MNKKQISFTIDPGLLELVDSKVKEGVYRNRSHAFEVGIRKLMLQ